MGYPRADPLAQGLATLDTRATTGTGSIIIGTLEKLKKHFLF